MDVLFGNRHLDGSQFSNQIASIPKVDSKLRSLEDLIISKNRISEIPDMFLASLPSLKMLDASRNELSKLYLTFDPSDPSPLTTVT